MRSATTDSLFFIRKSTRNKKYNKKRVIGKTKRNVWSKKISFRDNLERETKEKKRPRKSFLFFFFNLFVSLLSFNCIQIIDWIFQFSVLSSGLPAHTIHKTSAPIIFVRNLYERKITVPQNTVEAIIVPIRPEFLLSRILPITANEIERVQFLQ